MANRSSNNNKNRRIKNLVVNEKHRTTPFIKGAQFHEMEEIEEMRGMDELPLSIQNNDDTTKNRRISHLVVNELHRTTPYVKASDLERAIMLEKEEEERKKM